MTGVSFMPRIAMWPSLGSAASRAMTGDTGATGPFTFVVTVGTAGVSAYGSQWTVVFEAPAGTTLPISAAYFGMQATSGDAYDFAASPAPVQLFWAGSATKTILAGQTAETDRCFIKIPSGNGLSVAFWINSTQAFRFIANGSNWTGYFGPATNDASTVNKSGYTAYNQVCVNAFKVAG